MKLSKIFINSDRIRIEFKVGLKLNRFFTNPNYQNPIRIRNYPPSLTEVTPFNCAEHVPNWTKNMYELQNPKPSTTSSTCEFVWFPVSVLSIHLYIYKTRLSIVGSC
ncbi:hypothetical protein WN943_016368 [Citrus x changshan-huyou]